MLKFSCCVVYKDLLYYCLWANSLTRKLVGYKVKLDKDKRKREKLIHYVLNGFSFNMLPINLLEVEENKCKLKIFHSAYVKIGETFFSGYNCLFSSKSVNLSAEQMGLTDTKYCKPRFPAKKLSLKNNLDFYNIQQIVPTTACVVHGVKKLEELKEKEYIQETRRKFEQSEKSLGIASALEILKIKNSEQKYSDEFYKKLQKGNWVELPTKSTIEVFGFVVITTQKFPIVAIYCRQVGEDFFKIYYVKGLFKHKLIEFNNIAKQEGFKPVAYKEHFFHYWPKETPFLVIESKEHLYYNGFKYVDISVASEFEGLTLEEKESIQKAEENVRKAGELVEKFSMQPLSLGTRFTISRCKKLEDLEEGIYTVNSITTTVFRGKSRYIFILEEKGNLEYISNSFMEKELEEKSIDFNFRFKIKADILKYDKSRKKNRAVFVSHNKN
ncbi:hypothetical protein LSTR_LSTR016540 [Laodelphax striatellus]|uniref:Uncharacterized protein n=1 Tax=Laodelphax striatellus TaxID=195883 RepID=A0A482XJP6_LAOST|nr:hypothetical protein LSTR_LSTR016540 [Laodelphax striatellus]